MNSLVIELNSTASRTLGAHSLMPASLTTGSCLFFFSTCGCVAELLANRTSNDTQIHEKHWPVIVLIKKDDARNSMLISSNKKARKQSYFF